jgi:two-component system, NarL family, invasion response regulator UvrY
MNEKKTDPDFLNEEITVLIVDDHALIRENWAYILKREDRFLVIGECSSAEETMEFVNKRVPQVILMDINLPGMDGITATRLLANDHPDIIIIGVSMHYEPEFASAMMQSGARGYITKTSSREELLQAIMEAREGKKYICEEVSKAGIASTNAKGN